MSTERNKAQSLVEDLYEKLKINHTVPDDIKESLNRNYDDDGDGNFFQELEENFIQINTNKESKITLYIKLKEIKLNNDPLE
ncbi:15605_t:CDS:1, partial [Cetraspora pellucida]